jgi:hypothetical protein
MEFMELMLNERAFSNKDRSAAAKSGVAMPDGSFPIENEEDLHNAVQAIGRAKNPAKAKAHIKSRAAALGCNGCLPKEWGESVERSIFANVEQLDEAATTYQPSTGDLTITVIKPGWSKNKRYYSPTLLKGAVNIFEGAKMFVDHQTEKDAAVRPEGSVRDWVGTITGVKAEADGSIKATANIHNEAFKTSLQNLKKAGNLNTMGISIRAYGEAVNGEAEGRKGTIIESLLRCKSVDFVTYAAAGGQVESMSEAVDPDDVMLLDIDALRAKRPDLVAALEVKQPTRQSPIKKHNGANGSFVEGSPFNGEHTITETDNTPHNPYAKLDEVLAETITFPPDDNGLTDKRPLTENEKRLVRGMMSVEAEEAYKQLNEAQKKEFEFNRSIGISEADAFKLTTPAMMGRGRRI